MHMERSKEQIWSPTREQGWEAAPSCLLQIPAEAQLLNRCCSCTLSQGKAPMEKDEGGAHSWTWGSAGFQQLPAEALVLRAPFLPNVHPQQGAEGCQPGCDI